MSNTEIEDRQFITIAIKNGLVSKEKVDRAYILQRRIYTQAKVHKPICDILIQMGIITEAQKAQLNAARNVLMGKREEPADEVADDALPDINTARELELTISKDGLQAFIHPEHHQVQDVRIEDLRLFLNRRRIKFGVVDDGQIKSYLSQSPLPEKSFLIAVGQEPESPTPPELKFYFDTNPLRIGRVNEDGSIDWKDRGKLPQVNAGDLIAEIIPGNPGKPGKNVTGKTIVPPKLPKIRLKRGKGVDRSEDGHRFVARTGGMPQLIRKNRVQILSTLNIDGDIGLETGHVEFDGHIEVNGIVQAGYRVKGASIRAKELYNAEFEISGDIISLGGIYRAKIQSNGNLRASHIHTSDLTIFGDVVVEKEIFESTIETNGQLVIDNGTIISSKISAKKGIYANDIGTEASKKCDLDVGIDHRLEREVNLLKADIEKNGKLVQLRKADIEKARQRSDYLNTQLGEIAQEQDGYMVKQRDMDAKLSEAEADKDELQIAFYQKTIRELGEKRNEIDAIVEKYLEEDEGILANIPVYERDVAETEGHIEAAEQKIKALEIESEADPGHPEIKISGTIFNGTCVTSPKATLTTREDYTHTSMRETDVEDGVTTKKFRIKTTSL
ncbi:MAG: DUF342 domain-containing protein [Desulfobacteraceae bacterium]|nr:DUF342 domain-containing protein [Desulfobacteraceae bacterium]